MTNTEYEAASIDAATGAQEIDRLDREIAFLSRRVDFLMERRRELINRYNLNKCEHKRIDCGIPYRDECLDCGEVVSW